MEAASGASAACSKESSWLVFTISVAAAKCGIGTTSSITTLLSFSIFLPLAYTLLCLLCWVVPGGPAWGRYWLLTRCRWGSPKATGAVPPGPRGIPILGSMELMSGLAHRNLARAASSLKAERLMAFSLGETRAVVTADPEVAKEVLNGDAFTDRPEKESAYGLMFHRSIGFAPYGDYWRALRRIAAGHLFCPQQIAASGPHRAEIANQVVAALKTKAAAASEEAAAPAVCVRDVLKQAALNNVMGSVFGKRYDVGEEKHNWETAELRYLVEEGYDLLGILNWSDHVSLLARFDLQGIRARCEAVMPRVNAFVGRIIEDHRQQRRRQQDVPPSPAASRDFVDVMLSMQESQGGLSDQDIIAVLWEMIFRGTDTVAVLLEWVLARVTMHRDVQEKLHAELDRVVGRSRAVEEKDVAALPYLQAVIKETLRVHPPGPLMSWARLSTRDTLVDGRHVPKGTVAMVNMWAITHDPRVWDRPDEFLPERFLAATGGCAAAAAAPPFLGVFGSDLRLAPFGSGKRGCPGKAMGMAAVEFWLASLLHEFEWIPPAAAAGAIDLSERLRLSCEMAVPLAARLVPRRR